MPMYGILIFGACLLTSVAAWKILQLYKNYPLHRQLPDNVNLNRLSLPVASLLLLALGLFFLALPALLTRFT